MAAQKRSRLTTTGSANINDIIATDDILSEILLRLPDSKSLLRSSSVSKRWRSLISAPDFRRRYAASFSPRRSFIFQDKFSKHCRPHSLFHRNAESRLSDAIVLAMTEVKAPITVRASSGDLVLLSGKEFFVANAVTNDVLPLPPVPHGPDNYSRLAVLRDRHSGLLSRVVAISLTVFYRSRNKIMVSVFSPEAEGWEERMVCPPQGLSRYCFPVKVVVAGGVMYWLNVSLRDRTASGLIALDCTTFSCSHIDVPSNLSIRAKQLLGVCREKLRISNVFKEPDERGRFVIEVWELRTTSTSWSLVHRTRLQESCRVMHVIGFHSEDGDILYLLMDDRGCRYNVSENKVERDMGEFLGNPEWMPHSNVVCQLVSQPWPTPLLNENIERKSLQEYFFR